MNAKPRRLEIAATFTARDGTRLFYRFWPAPDQRAGTVILLHRGHEHSGRIRHLVAELELPDFAFFALDLRGHGRSGNTGDPSDFLNLARDLDDFAGVIIGQLHDISMDEVVIIGQSVGAVAGALWVQQLQPRIRAMVLAAPAFSIRLYVPFARPMMRMGRRFHLGLQVKSYVQPSMLTRDRARMAAYRADPLISRSIDAGLLLDLDAWSRELVRLSHTIQVPTQVLVSGRDHVVETGPQVEFHERVGTGRKELHVLRGLRHDTLGERDRAEAVARARAFALEQFPERVSLPVSSSQLQPRLAAR